MFSNVISLCVYSVRTVLYVYQNLSNTCTCTYSVCVSMHVPLYMYLYDIASVHAFMCSLVTIAAFRGRGERREKEEGWQLGEEWIAF